MQECMIKFIFSVSAFCFVRFPFKPLQPTPSRHSLVMLIINNIGLLKIVIELRDEIVVADVMVTAFVMEVEIL